MILIADSGSTKTDWRIIDREGKVKQAQTLGFNPYYQPIDNIQSEIQHQLIPKLQGEPTYLYFYGAGCSSVKNTQTLNNLFQQFFPNAQVTVNHDLLAAARALCNKEAGIACILGTGTNSCLYDGEEIVDNIPSLGYALGDEGSGAYLGKVLLSNYLRREIPENISDKLEKRFHLKKDTILEAVYQKEMPSRYLAGFSKFIFQNLKEPYLYRLVYESFEAFLERNIVKYENYLEHKVHFTGSVAFYYSNILRQVANDKGIIVKNILESPIAGLTLYHQNL